MVRSRSISRRMFNVYTTSERDLVRGVGCGFFLIFWSGVKSGIYVGD